MKKIIAIAWKDTIVRFSDKSEFLFLLILPIVFTFILTGVGGGQAEAIPLLVVNADQSDLADELITALSESDSVKVSLLTSAEAERQFNQQKASAWLTIPAGFERVILAGQEGQLDIRRTPNNTNADVAERTIRTAASTVNRSLAVARISLAEAERLQPFANEADRQAYFSTSLAEARKLFDASPQRVKATRPATQDTGKYSQGTQASTGQLVIWVFIPLLGTSGLLAFERNQKTLPRLVTTPTKAATFLLGTITGQLGAALIQMLLLIAFGVYVLQINWGNSPIGLALMLVSFGLASVAMGVAMGTFVKTEKQATNLSIMFGMLFSMLGGCGWPIELFPPAMQKAAQLLPTYWAMQGFNNMAMRGLGLDAVVLPVAVLLGFAVVFFIIGAARFSYE